MLITKLLASTASPVADRRRELAALRRGLEAVQALVMVERVQDVAGVHRAVDRLGDHRVGPDVERVLQAVGLDLPAVREVGLHTEHRLVRERRSDHAHQAAVDPGGERLRRGVAGRHRIQRGQGAAQRPAEDPAALAVQASGRLQPERPVAARGGGRGRRGCRRRCSGGGRRRGRPRRRRCSRGCRRRGRRRRVVVIVAAATDQCGGSKSCSPDGRSTEQLSPPDPTKAEAGCVVVMRHGVELPWPDVSRDPTTAELQRLRERPQDGTGLGGDSYERRRGSLTLPTRA